MDLRIFKYELELKDSVDVEMPKDAFPLSVGEQEGKLIVWVAVNPAKKKVLHKFRIAGTGHPLDHCGGFIGTVQMFNGLVWHVFDRGRSK